MYYHSTNICVFSLKTNKTAGYDDLILNIFKRCLIVICEPPQYLLTFSLEKESFC